ncbi:MAG: glycosyltransferase, partial [Bryocella sp.]
LMPSEMESFGLAALEAMACCVPAIATNVGGVPELIESGHNGLLYEVGDITGMVEGALSLLTDPAALEKMSCAARKTAQDRFCATRIIPHYERFYQQIIDAHS